MSWADTKVLERGIGIIGFIPRFSSTIQKIQQPDKAIFSRVAHFAHCLGDCHALAGLAMTDFFHYIGIVIE
ncbi:MAG: hypothetical protein GYA26_12215 [Flexilinea flocculi]|jgi:hypothetical protein|nr:hypothetical protein [Flexilinea flocculi]